MSLDEPLHPMNLRVAEVRQGARLVTTSPQGPSPAPATWLGRRFQAEFGPEYRVLLDVPADARDDLRSQGVSTAGSGWQKALDSGILEMVREGRVIEAKERLQACLSSSSE